MEILNPSALALRSQGMKKQTSQLKLKRGELLDSNKCRFRCGGCGVDGRLCLWATEQSGWGGSVLADGKSARGMCSWNYLGC